MRSILCAVVAAGLAYGSTRYNEALATVVGAQGYFIILIAGVVGFLPPWLMSRAFMTREEAERIAARVNGRPDYYDFDENRMVRNPQDADPESIKLQYLMGSLAGWVFQFYLVYRAFFYR